MSNNELTIINENTIKDKIYVIRGKQVMLDYDLAEYYGYSVKAFNQQVQRNKDKFPSSWLFKINRDELDLVRSQIVTSRNKPVFSGQSGGIRYLPSAFTKKGVYMLMTYTKEN